MFGIGSTELLVILLVALIVLGPKSLAGAARSLGKAMGEFRRVSTDFQRTLNMEAAQEEAREAEEKRRKQAAKETTQVAKPSDQSASTEPPDVPPTEDPLAKLPPDSPVVKAVVKAKETAGENSND